MSQRILTVSTLVHYLKQKLDQDMMIQKVLVQGEISNFTHHRSGHLYFTLKDQGSRISCVMFAMDAGLVQFKPKEGDKVIVQANTTVFETTGSMQLRVTKMKQDGLGDLFVEFERLKKKLFEEGLFAEEHKKVIPPYPMSIGLVTGASTAAREDVLITLKKRWPVATIVEYPCLVQGENASKDMIMALQRADQDALDVILLVRGGGSIEDLWAFNDETLAKVIYHMNTPICTGVGHEVDTTIVDFVSDLRAATPTAAAQRVTPDLIQVRAEIEQYKKRIELATKQKLLLKTEQLNYLKSKQVLNNPELLFEKSWMMLDFYEDKLNQTAQRFQLKRNEYLYQKEKLISCIEVKITQSKNKLIYYQSSMSNSVTNILQSKRNKFIHEVALLDAYSPLKSLSRGYTIASSENQVITSINQLNEKQTFELTFQDGKIKAEVLSKEEKHD